MTASVTWEEARIELQVELAGAVPYELFGLLEEIGLRGRQVRGLAVRLGLDGGGARTLAEAGVAAGYTRERVRQLEDRVARYVREARPALPLTRSAVGLLARSAPIAQDSALWLLAGRGYVCGRFDLSGLLAVAEVAGIDHGLRLVGNGVCRHRDADLLPPALAAARRLQRRDGVVALPRLARELRGDASKQALRRLLAISARVIWLDDKQSWFVVDRVHKRVDALLRKMLTISTALTLDEVERGLRRSFQPVIVPWHIVAPLCELEPWLVVDRDRQTVTRKISFDRTQTLTPIERQLLDLFRDHGPVLSFAEAISLGSKAGLNRPTIGVYLTRSAVIERIERGRYVVRGVPVAEVTR
jgi:hypothetical protein